MTDMASAQQVKQYLAHWFQLGKCVWVRNGQEAIRPSSVLQGNRYSPEFEACWQRLLDPQSGDCYLEGTEQTIQELLSPEWTVMSCARCTMPIPMQERGTGALVCPCNDLPSWPNFDVPLPRLPVNNAHHLRNICERVTQIRSSQADA